MNDQDKFDELFRSKLNNRKFDFDDSKWEKARALIEADQRKKRRRFLGWMSFGGALLLGGGSLIYLNGQHSRPVEQLTDDLTAKTRTETNISTTSSTSTIQQITPSSDPSDQHSAAGGQDIAPVSQQPSVTQEKSDQKTISENNPGSTDLTKQHNEKKNPNTDKKRQFTPPVLVQDDQKDPFPKKDEQETKTQDPSLSGTNKQPVPENKTETQPTVNNGASKDSTPELVVNTPKDTSGKRTPDTTGTAPTTAPSSPPAPSAHAHPFTLSLTAGGNYVNHYGLAPWAGLHLSLSLSQRWDISMGALYTWMTPSKDSADGLTKSFIIHRAEYAFGSQYQMEDIRTDRLHYLAMPLTLQYHISDRHAVNFGVSAYYLLSTDNTITDYTISYYTRSGFTQKKDKGYASGIRPYDLGLTGGYEFTLVSKLKVGLSVNYGLTDIIKNEYYGIEGFERNLSGQIYLRYELFNK